MPNLKEIRTRIQSVKSTRQITSAMKMVSAAKLRKAQDVIIQMRPYANKLHEILEDLSSSLGTEKENVYASEREIKRVLLVVITSNRGLCGAFNSNVVKKAIQLSEETYKMQKASKNLEIYTIGKKGADLLKAKKYNVARSFNDLFDQLSYENVAPLASEIMADFVKGKFDKIELIYNQFRNAATQDLVNEQFLPVAKEEKPEERLETHSDYILEPSKEEIVRELIPKSLKIQFYKALLDSHASEHGARMTAMHKATDNATELINELLLHYNKARQAAITNEILEIVSGAEALKG